MGSLHAAAFGGFEGRRWQGSNCSPKERKLFADAAWKQLPGSCVFLIEFVGDPRVSFLPLWAVLGLLRGPQVRPAAWHPALGSVRKPEAHSQRGTCA